MQGFAGLNGFAGPRSENLLKGKGSDPVCSIALADQLCEQVDGKFIGFTDQLFIHTAGSAGVIQSAVSGREGDGKKLLEGAKVVTAGGG